VVVLSCVPRCSRELRLQTVPPPPAQQQTVRTHNPTPTLIPPPPPSFSLWNLRTRDCPTPPGSHRRDQEAREVRKQLPRAWFAHGPRMVLVPGGHHGWPAVHLGGGGRPSHIFSIKIYDCWGCVRAWVFHCVSGVLARWFGR
jgi:hypothetical protein